jgi:spore coat protein U-like protein
MLSFPTKQRLATSLMSVIMIFSLILSPVSAFAATTANISLSGTVVASISVAVDNTSYDFGDPATTSLVDQQVAAITVNSNASAGYTLNLTNTNGSFALVNGANSVAYSLKYNSVALTYGATVQLETDDGSGGSTTNSSKDLKVSLTADNTLPAGSYTDTLTLTIVAN